MNNQLNEGTFIFKDIETDEIIFMVNATETIEINESHTEPEPIPTYIKKLPPLTFTCNVGYWNTRALLSLITGQHITNNWLKMHGGVMTRKGKGRKSNRRKTQHET